LKIGFKEDLKAALTAITHMWHQALDDHMSVRALFVDYSKAFDHVDHSTVLSKMAALKADPSLHTLDKPPTTSQD